MKDNVWTVSKEEFLQIKASVERNERMFEGRFIEAFWVDIMFVVPRYYVRLRGLYK